MPNLNEYILLKKSPPQALFLKILIIIFLFILIMSFYIKIPDTKTFTALITCQEDCQIELLIPSNQMDLLNHHPTLVYQDKTYHITNINIAELTFNNDIPAAKVIITSDLKVSMANFINIKLQYNKQRIINKIINLIIGKE